MPWKHTYIKFYNIPTYVFIRNLGTYIMPFFVHLEGPAKWPNTTQNHGFAHQNGLPANLSLGLGNRIRNQKLMPIHKKQILAISQASIGIDRYRCEARSDRFWPSTDHHWTITSNHKPTPPNQCLDGCISKTCPNTQTNSFYQHLTSPLTVPLQFVSGCLSATALPSPSVLLILNLCLHLPLPHHNWQLASLPSL